MKRDLLFAALATIGIMMATSCTNDDNVIRPGDDAQVTFSLGIENAITTRAISDGSSINQLHYAIFSEGKLLISSKDKEVQFPFTTSIPLVKGEEYTAVFWAQNKECQAYTISDDMRSITVDYTNALNNDETRDAFFRSETFTVTDNTTINIVLKRPFTQLNVGIPEETWNLAEHLGVKFSTSEVEIKQAAGTLNLLDGSVDDLKDIKFAANDIPNEPLKVDINCDGTDESYKYLSMCYFLAPAEKDGAAKTLLDDIKFVFRADNGSSEITLGSITNVPVQRNHRTNIISHNILTGNIIMNISLDPLYDGEHNGDEEYVWDSYEGMYTEEALAGKLIEIDKNWHIRNGCILEPMPESWKATSSPLYEKSYTIDGKGNTITFEPYNYSFVVKNAFAAADSKEVTVKNITFAGEHFGVFGGVYGGVSGRNAYKTLLENVKIIGNGIYCYNGAGSIPMSAFSNLGTATLDNCTIKGTYWVGEKDTNANAQNCYDVFGIYDIFVPNNKLTTLNNSTIGTININNHGHLKVTGTSNIDKIDAFALVNGTITIGEGAKVTLLNVDEYTASYAPTVTIEAGATIETLQLNSITKTNKINIDDGANIAKIIYKGVEYTSIKDFKSAIGK